MDSTIAARIDEWAQKTPNAPCYEYNKEVLTYKELKEKSDAFALFLENKIGCEKNKPVIVYGHMSPLMIISFLAATKSGHPYIPIDKSVPNERASQIITASGSLAVILAEDADDEVIVNCKEKVITTTEITATFNKNEGKLPNPKNAVSGNDTYYIIYTSGSTGMPKGVQISHNNLASFSHWILQDFSFAQGMRVLNQAPYSFDLSVMGVYPTLLSGGTLLPLDKEISANLKDLYAKLPEMGLNVWVSTPSFVDVCLLDPHFNQETQPGLTNFLFCGEILTKETARELLKRFPKANVYNTYGPTEATVAVTQVKITNEIIDQYPSLPLGEMKPDSKLQIVSTETGEVLPDGEKGEIVLIGPSVSKGYLNDPEKTAQVFKEYPPFVGYHTGDAGIIKDGQLFFYGRLDFQVKLHGYRIELEDIENNLKEVSYIRSCVVIPKLVNGKVDSLVAFVVPNSHEFQKEYQLSSAIKKELQSVLPSYMIPRKWIYKESLPLTNNSKVDRKALALEVNE
nr:D-alanine--poly(phosphoribitol) ligase subunit DltA [Listeria sp. PSOL-1]